MAFAGVRSGQRQRQRTPPMALNFLSSSMKANPLLDDVSGCLEVGCFHPVCKTQLYCTDCTEAKRPFRRGNIEAQREGDFATKLSLIVNTAFKVRRIKDTISFFKIKFVKLTRILVQSTCILFRI